MANEPATFMVEGAQIIFRNFEGKEGQYNRKGDRNFAVILDEEHAKILAADGWNVKVLPPREEGDPEVPYIQVAVNFERRPPRVVMISSAGRTQLTEDTVEILDFAEIANADLICRAYNWEVNGKTGVKAYLQSLFITVEEDALELKYANMENREHSEG